jgi:DNA modification methylase
MRKSQNTAENRLNVSYVSIINLKAATYNPRKWSKEQLSALVESIKRFGAVDPLIVNSAPNRKDIIIGGHMRLAAMKELGYTEVPVVYINILDEAKERELNLRLNRNTGEFDLALLAKFDESLLSGIGFTSEELDQIFPTDDNPEMFDLDKELDKLNIKDITIQKGDRYSFGDDVGVVMCGDSTIESDMLKLMDGDTADMCMTDPPYILNYLKGKTKNKDGVTLGFGAKKNRRYLETDVLPPDFTEKWMASVAAIQKKDFSIIIFENPKNLKTIWTELEKHWKYRNTITWHVPNRMQGFSSKFRFFNKTDIALVGSRGNVALNLEPESDELFQNEYDNAIFATTGSPHWESYEKGKKICPTDFISHIAADKKSSGQEIIFGTKPLELLIPYIKVLTKRGDIVVEPFGGSGSTAMASWKLGRKFRLMEKSCVYTAVILNRITRVTGITPKKI